MRSVALVKKEGTLRNTQPSAHELQNLDLSRPSQDLREQNLIRTKVELGIKVDKKTENVFLYAAANKKREED